MTKYRALVDLSVPVDQAEVDRIKAARDAGTPLNFEDRQMRQIKGGELADIPNESVSWLLEQNLIEQNVPLSKSRAQFIWSEVSGVYHDRQFLTENCNIDDIDEKHFALAAPEYRELCRYCATNKERLND